MRDLAIVVSNANKTVTPKETMDAIKAAGFKKIFLQWYDEPWEMTQEEQLDYAKELGLEVIFAHLGYQNINDIWVEGKEGDDLVLRYINDIKSCKDHGIDLVILHVSSKSQAPMYSEIGLNRIRKIVEYAKTQNVKVAFENNKIKGYIDYIMENVKDDNVGICFDAGHCHAHFNDEFDYPSFKNRFFAVHLHDNFGELDEHLMPYDGTMDWDKVMNSIKDTNYQGPVTLELVYRKKYLDMSVNEFFKKGYEIGLKLADIIGD